MDAIESLFLTHGRVEELAFDDRLIDHLNERGTYAKHVVSLAEILEVHQGRPRYFLNTGSGARRAPAIMLGLTARGRCLCVPIEPVGSDGVWRPVTAFEANAHHREKYEEGQP
jgi:hypothetical protein